MQTIVNKNNSALYSSMVRKKLSLGFTKRPQGCHRSTQFICNGWVVRSIKKRKQGKYQQQPTTTTDNGRRQSAELSQVVVQRLCLLKPVHNSPLSSANGISVISSEVLQFLSGISIRASVTFSRKLRALVHCYFVLISLGKS